MMCKKGYNSNIFIQIGASGIPFPIEYKSINPILEIKLRIENYTQIPSKSQKLYFNGTLLDDNANPSDYKITNSSIIQLEID